MNNKRYKLAIKMAESRVGYIILKCIYMIILSTKSLINHFKRDVYVSVKDVHWTDDSGKLRKYPGSFNIHVISNGKESSLFGNIEISEADKIIHFLQNDKRGKSLIEMDVGVGTTSLTIPRWAKPIVISELMKLKNERSSDISDYKKWAEELSND